MDYDDPVAQLKVQAWLEIMAVVGEWNQHVAARAVGIDQPRMSDLMQGKLERFSLERLLRCLVRLDRQVELRVVATRPARMFRFPDRMRRRGDYYGTLPARHQQLRPPGHVGKLRTRAATRPAPH